MSNIVAGIGRGQLKVLNDRIEEKRYIYNRYKEAFSEIECLEMMPINNNWQRSNCWLSCMTIDKHSGITPLEVQLALEKNNIESRPVWKPMHLQPVFKEYDYMDNNHTAEHLFESGICLPSDTKMTDDDIVRVISIIKDIFKK